MKKFSKRLAVFVMVLSVLATGLCIDANAASKSYKFKYKGVTVNMNGKAQKLIEKMGDIEPKKSASCMYDGDDYTYDGKDFVLCTYTKKKGGTQYIQSIRFKTSKVKTAEGVKIGSRESTVKKKYGKKAKPNFGMYIFQKGKSSLYITVENSKVTGIEYVALL